MVNIVDKLNAFLKGVIYYLTSHHRKGNRIHSPAVFEFVSNVLYDKKKYKEYALIEERIDELIKDHSIVDIEDYGAGSAAFSSKSRRISDIARLAGTDRKMGRLLFRMSRYYNPSYILEMGTSVGIGTIYLAKGAQDVVKVHTIEANKNLVDIARQNAVELQCENIEYHVGLFDEELPELINNIDNPALIYIDGNHTYNATMNYFRLLDQKVHKGFIIIDDIYWSRGMENAWKEIRMLSEVSIDLYSVGIIVKGEMLTPWQYKIKY